MNASVRRAALSVAAAIILSFPSLACADPPAGFMSTQMFMLESIAPGRVVPLKISVSQFVKHVAGNSPVQWKEIGNGQWRLKFEEVDKLTDKKGSVVILLASDSRGVQVPRIVFNDAELAEIQRIRVQVNARDAIQKGSKR